MRRPDPERWKRLSRILDEALELTEEERAARVRRLCGSDATLLADVEEFLAADAEAGGVLSAPTGAFVGGFVRKMEQPDGSFRPDRASVLRQMTDALTVTVAAGSCPDCGEPLSDGERSCSRCAATRLEGDAVDREFDGLRQIAGYRIERELGGGGMGTVFEAVDEKMNRTVALKVMSRHLGTSDKSAKRFVNEAWIAGRLSHPNLVKVFDRGEWEDLNYYSMELVGGGSLHDVITRMRRFRRDDRLELAFAEREYLRWAVSRIISAANGLEYAHRDGVVHRDIKPMNLLLSASLATVKIADFGLAFEQEGTRLTTAGKVMGTMAYMSPEQMRGDLEQVDARTDVYALGVTLFELLTLELPYVAPNFQSYMQAVQTNAPRRPGKLNGRIDRDLEVVILKAIEKEPRDRYATAAALAEDLQNVLDRRPIEARPPGTITRLRKWVQRKPVHAALAALVIVGLPLTGFLGQRELERRAAERHARVEAMVEEVQWLGHQRGHHAEQIEKAAEILRLDPHNIYGLSHRALGRMRQALAVEGQADTTALRRAALTDASRLVELAPDASWSHRVKGYVLRHFGDGEAAAAERALAARSTPALPTTLDLSIEGLLAMGEGDYDRAIELYSALVRKSPQDALAVSIRAAAYDYKEDFDAAYREYRIAVGLDPQAYLPLIDLARLTADQHQAFGEYSAAREFADRAIVLDPESAHAHEMLAHVLILWASHAAGVEGKAERATELLREAATAARRSVELEPERPWALVNLARALTDQARLLDSPEPALLEEAVRSCERALAILDRPLAGVTAEAEQARAFAVTNLCDARIELRRLDEAVEACTEATRMLPDNPVPFYNLAAVHALAGRHAESLEALQRDLELGDTEWWYVEKDAKFDGLRDDPTFRRILADMKQADSNR